MFGSTNNIIRHLLSDYFLAACNAFLFLMFRKPRGLQRSKLELGQLMPTWMSGCRFASFSIHSKYTTLQNDISFWSCIVLVQPKQAWWCVTVYLYLLCTGYCVYPVSVEQIKEEKVEEQLSGGCDSCNKA